MSNESKHKVIPLTGDRDRIIEIGILADRVRAALGHYDSTEPDSFGDQLFRSSLLLRMAIRNGFVSLDTVDTAKALLAQHDQNRGLPAR